MRAAPAGALSRPQLVQMREIYREAFPPALRVPFGELTIAGEADRSFAALDGEHVAGFAVPRLLGSAGWSSLRHFAIARDRRARGRDGSSGGCCASRWRARPGPAGSCSRSRTRTTPAKMLPNG